MHINNKSDFKLQRGESLDVETCYDTDRAVTKVNAISFLTPVEIYV